MNIFSPLTTFNAALLATTLLGATVCSSQELPATAGSGTDIPDFSGWWYLDLPVAEKLPFAWVDAPFRPQYAAIVQQVDEQRATGNMGDPIDSGALPGYQCIPPSFTGAYTFISFTEFLFSPGRLTILDETGLVRRVALDRTALPAMLDETNVGTSIGHWEGQTLIIETAGLKPTNPAILNIGIGAGAHIVERITFADPDTLDIFITMTAPELLIQPYQIHQILRRDRNHTFHEELLCTLDDRSIDPVTGRQRLDMSPPPDLPPLPLPRK